MSDVGRSARLRVLLLGAVAVAATAIGVSVFGPNAPAPLAGAPARVPATILDGVDAAVSTAPTPFTVVADESHDGGPEPAIDPVGRSDPSGTGSDPGSIGRPAAAPASTASSLAPSNQIASVGGAAWTNQEFARQLARFRADPQALALLIDAFRSESDPARLERLAALLGQIGHPDLSTIGAQMVASGDPVSRDAGLALLQQLQPGDAAARETLIGLLATESDPVVLDAVIDAVSVPVPGAQDQAQALVAHLVPLARHPSPAVRRNGVAVLSRWATDASVRPVLQAALGDEDADVRASAVYAFAEQPDLDESIRQDLLAVLEDGQESRGTRSGAMLALQRTELDPGQRQRLLAVERELASTL